MYHSPLSTTITCGGIRVCARDLLMEDEDGIVVIAATAADA